jgi:polyisoprenyl-phosphate glycosyltransferase
MKDDLISVVIPVYMGEPYISRLTERVKSVIHSIPSDYEILLVDDASPDGAWDKIIEECRKDSKVKAINFSRNFGQHYAISAGLKYAVGNWIVVMDCDLQDVPEEINQLYYKAQEGYDIVYGKRKIRNDSVIKKIHSRLYYLILGYLTETKQDSDIANFGIYNKKCIHSFLQMGDYSRNFNTMIRWTGFNTTSINVSHSLREIGKSSYNFKKSFSLALDTILSFSDKPLRITIKFGFLISISSFLLGVYYLIKYFSGEITVLGYTSLIISIWFLSGLIISIIGMVGLYIGKIYEKVKERPLYIIKDIINLNIK